MGGAPAPNPTRHENRISLEPSSFLDVSVVILARLLQLADQELSTLLRMIDAHVTSIDLKFQVADRPGIASAFWRIAHFWRAILIPVVNMRQCYSAFARLDVTQMS